MVRRPGEYNVTIAITVNGRCKESLLSPLLRRWVGAGDRNDARVHGCLCRGRLMRLLLLLKLERVLDLETGVLRLIIVSGEDWCW